MTTLHIHGTCEYVSGELVAAYAWIHANDMGEVICQGTGKTSADRPSNHLAEYAGLKAALMALIQNQFEGDVTVMSSNMLVINQITGKWQVKSDKLRRLVNDVKILVDAATNGEEGKPMSVKFQWIPIGRNKNAKQLSMRELRQ